MSMYSYVITRDYGFAPNPDFGMCTLATCKPDIRKHAHIGDWVGAFGGKNTAASGRMVMLMKVTEAMSFDQYWEDARFLYKQPVSTKGLKHMYGDNIYHHVGDEWIQEPSHHSHEDGSINYLNLKTDTKTDRVLISAEFYYFGNQAIFIPEEFQDLVGKCRGYQVCRDEEHILTFIQYMESQYSKGIHGLPFSRKPGVFTQYKGQK